MAIAGWGNGLSADIRVGVITLVSSLTEFRAVYGHGRGAFGHRADRGGEKVSALRAEGRRGLRETVRSPLSFIFFFLYFFSSILLLLTFSCYFLLLFLSYFFKISMWPFFLHFVLDQFFILILIPVFVLVLLFFFSCSSWSSVLFHFLLFSQSFSFWSLDEFRGERTVGVGKLKT